MMEKLPMKKNHAQVDYIEMLKELQHEYGAFLLSKKYGGKDNIPQVGNLWATHYLDKMHN